MDVKTATYKMKELYEDAVERYKNIELETSHRILIVGMGGSGIAGKILEHYFEDKNIIGITNHYIPQKYKEYDIIAVSYSGNTHETLEVFNANKGKIKAVLTSGGRLKEHAIKENIPIIDLPKGLAPRASLPYMVVALTEILKGMSIISEEEANKIYKDIRSIRMDKIKDIAEKTADEIKKDDVVVFLSDYKNYPASYRSKTQINENCKIHSYAEYFSEHNHNSIQAVKQKTNIFYVLYNSKDPSIASRMDFFESLLKDYGFAYQRLDLDNMFEYIAFGDLLSVALSEKYNIDSDDITIIEALKKYVSG